MKIGFLGVGTIASCVIEGFCSLDSRHEFYLSPRNAEKSEALGKKYKNVTVCKSNREVLDNAETVFISVLPKACLDMLRELRFKPGHMVINVAASVPLEEIKKVIGPVKSLSHVVPLPFIGSRVGPIAAFPESPELKELLSPLGTVVFGKSMDEVRVLQAITSLMSPFNEMMSRLSLFAEAEGVGRTEAVAYITSFFSALCHRAANETNMSLHELAVEMTPGGLNEMALNMLSESGAISDWAKVMEPSMKRLRG